MIPGNPTVQPTAWGIVRHYWKISGGRPLHVILPVALILVSNAFEGASLALILPLTDGGYEPSGIPGAAPPAHRAAISLIEESGLWRSPYLRRTFGGF
ncbi:MAG: hypothetical protein HN396_04795 [Gemmatimonadales bacterium]|jgi:hypothetical protein|nr:hypothetical protein [Gemmatimonadales bacterium]MDG2238978.1 hypothetical protein [Longimicrobiales bacterium]NCG32593.1 hypothetical protein [Pseudomonadota bacterium]MBT3498994.1 hypothetical protein [Gemmatimonadales bacterium]MBT3774395.1 hypothetical protein [Gemmatimonadales bacterium]